MIQKHLQLQGCWLVVRWAFSDSDPIEQLLHLAGRGWHVVIGGSGRKKSNEQAEDTTHIIVIILGSVDHCLWNLPTLCMRSYISEMAVILHSSLM